MSKQRHTKWEKEVKKGLLKLPEVANVNRNTGKRKTHNHLEIELKSGTLLPMTYSKSPSDRHAMRNLLSMAKRMVANDNSPVSMDA
jgi:hypothetical protein